MKQANQEGLRNRIEILKKEFNLRTGSAFAKYVGINRSNFYQAMKGEERLIGEAMINKIALSLSINRQWLLTGIGDIHMNEEERKRDKILDNQSKLVDAHLILVKNSETLTETNRKLVDQNQELFEENKKLRASNEQMMKDINTKK